MPGRPSRKRSDRPKVGLALAGGGPGGAIYEIGALRALDEAVLGVDLNDLEVYVGVSAGAFIAASLVNDLTPSQMVRAIVKHEPGEHPFVPETFVTPDFGELLRRGLSIPRLLRQAVWSWATRPGDDSLLGETLSHLSRALPVGVFDNEPIRAYLENIYTLKGRTDDFRQLDKKLIVVAADLDSGEAVRFGESGFDHVPISRAVQASTAVPGLYSPVEIDGRFYLDGVLLKTLHASVALDAGADLLICINPIVPVDTVRAVEEGVMRRGRLVDRGLPSVLAQTFRTLIHSRMRVGMKAYEGRYKAKVILLEPKRDDYRMFFTNIFGFADRRTVCEHAYQQTRAELRRRYHEFAPIFESHGLELRREVLFDLDRDLWAGVGLDPGSEGSQLVSRLDHALRRLDEVVEDGGPLGAQGAEEVGELEAEEALLEEAAS
jgi:predicted acylesterase/phospholipase RssA